jgi:hypothetical protein
MRIISICAFAGLSLLIFVAYQLLIGNEPDGLQVFAGGALVLFSLLSWMMTRRSDDDLSIHELSETFPVSSGNRPLSSHDDDLVIQPISEIPRLPRANEGLSPHRTQSWSPFNVGGTLTVQQIQNNLPRGPIDGSGMRPVRPTENIPEEATCTMCQDNMLQTRNMYGGTVICPQCGHWYHRDHFYNMASGHCQSIECKSRR